MQLQWRSELRVMCERADTQCTSGGYVFISSFSTSFAHFFYLGKLDHFCYSAIYLQGISLWHYGIYYVINICHIYNSIAVSKAAILLL